MTAGGIGEPLRRKEDRRFLLGKGRYTDDINLPHQAHAHVVRSPHAHARVASIDATRAEAMPGVLAVFTGADLAADRVGGPPCAWLVRSKDGSPMVEPPHPPLAEGRVRHVGDQVALVVAETRAQAKAAARELDVAYEALPAVARGADAVAPGAPLVWEQAPGNVCFDWELGDRAAVEAAFAAAHKVVDIELVNNRLAPSPIEPRAAIGHYDAAGDRYTLYTTSQSPHLVRLMMAAHVLKVPEHRVRVVAPDVGGGFGAKVAHYAEEAIVAWASRRLGRPVKWVAERGEGFASDTHGRDHVTRARLALDADGRFLALRVETVANLGAYLSLFAAATPTHLSAPLLAGVYATKAVYAEVKGVFTNTVPVDAYRGGGRAEATYLLERLVDKAARETGIDRVELRRRNLIPNDAFPYRTPLALEYDVGDYRATLELALRESAYESFEARRAEARARGKLRGIGLSTYVDACGLAPSAVAGALGCRTGLYDAATVRVHPTGGVTVFTGAHGHGQGHETTFAQIVADRLGVSPDDVDVVHGDTDKVPFGPGSFAARSLAVCGSAVAKALDQIVEKSRAIAAHLLGADAGDVGLDGGAFRAAGADRRVTFAETASAAYAPHDYPREALEPGLEATAFYDPKNFTFPAGCHVVEVEVDPETGEVELAAVTVADDVGRVINPLIVEGQIHGGLAQGIGQALYENCAYDDEGRLLSGSFLTYAVPRAADLPAFKVGLLATPCAHNPLGAKGAGEIGAIGAPPAVMNAVLDALAPAGVTHLDMPATPERVWRALRDARGQKGSSP